MGLDVDAVARQLLGDWIATRRDFHRHPELGFTEYRTVSMIHRKLATLGYALRVGPEVIDRDAMVGVPDAATIRAAQERAIAQGADPQLVVRMPNGTTALVAEMVRGEGPVTAFRFDIDALPLEETTARDHKPVAHGYASVHGGVMHACGHDGHTAIGLGLAELAAHPDASWTGTLRLIFQPAEEGGRGARAMAEAGIVDDVDWFYGLHIGCDLPSGEFGVVASDMMFSTKFDACFSGVAAHAAGNPEIGRNALLAAAQAALGLHSLPRHGNAATQVNVGRLVAGTARNVVAASATMETEVRAAAEDALVGLEERARWAMEGAARSFGCRVDIAEMGRTVGETPTRRAVELVRQAVSEIEDISAVHEAWPLKGSEDVAYFMRRVKERGGEAVFSILGSDLAACHHAVDFDFVEPDIEIGVRLFYRLLVAGSAVSRGVAA